MVIKINEFSKGHCIITLLFPLISAIDIILPKEYIFFGIGWEEACKSTILGKVNSDRHYIILIIVLGSRKNL